MSAFTDFDVTADLPEPRAMRAVEASAGTGKTYSITTTVLRLVIEDGLTLDRLLVATFTRAATADLIDRTRGRLTEAEAALRAALADEPPPDGTDDALQTIVEEAGNSPGHEEALRRVRDALGRLDEATITTIHGFCQRVLSSAAFSAGVETGLRLETDDARLVREIVDDWTVALLHDASEPFASMRKLCNLEPDDLRDLGRAVAQEPDLVTIPESPDPRDPRRLYDEAFGALHRALRSPEERDALSAAADAAKGTPDYAGTKWVSSKLAGHVESAAVAVASSCVPDQKDLQRLHPDWETNNKGEGMPAPIGETAIPQAIEDFVDVLTEVEGIVRSQLAHHVRTTLDARRADTGTASFADLLRRLDDALHRPAATQLVDELREAYDAVLVDEFQDTDPVQWRILQTLFGQGRHFDVVGDPKQAIYGWRGADLGTYLRAVEAAEDRVFTMGTNWRSDQPYVEACNALFAGDDVFGAPVDTDAETAARVGYVPVTAAPDNRAAALLDATGAPRSGLALTFHRRSSDDKTLNIGVLTYRVVGRTVEEIITTIEDGWTIEGRKVGAGDCAVLTRTKVQARSVVAELQRRGVPAVLGGGRDVLETPEAVDIAALLDALLTPSDERALRRVLVGPFVGLDAQGVTDLDEAERATWFDRISSWSRTWSMQGVAAAIARALRDGGGERTLAGLRSGERTLTNLRHVAEVLHRAEREESLGPHALAAWFAMRRAEVTDPDFDVELPPEERELRLERDADAVRVLTIHTSKGLEFPLVWLPFPWVCDLKEPDRGKRTRPFTVNDPDRGGQRVLSLLPAGNDRACEDAEYQRLRELWRRAEWEAGHRLAYVALTRGEHRTTVHLGGVKEFQGSSLWHLLYRDAFGVGGPLGAPELPGDEELLAGLRRVGEDHDGAHVEVEEATDAGGDTRLSRPEAAAESEALRVREWSRTEALDVRWGRASYSGLVNRGGPAASGASDADAADHDADARFVDLAPLDEAAVLAAELVPLSALPRGADWGTFVHDVLEHADFDADVQTLDDLVRRRSLVTGFRVNDADRSLLATGLHAALATPLRGPFDGHSLHEVPRSARIDELEFVLELASRDSPVDLGAIADVLAKHAQGPDDRLLAATAAALRRRATEPVHGVLTGFIDLTFRAPTDAGDRWYIADYKTNGLGQRLRSTGTYVETAAHQHPDRVASSMVEKGYVLQAHLYVVALHRFLRSRIGPTYDYEAQVGGWTYLYLRGMTGPDSQVTHDGRPHGIVTGRPAPALVDDLDRLLGGRGL